jgi:glycosyltransferase involved in cell wall biosynthesis
MPRLLRASDALLVPLAAHPTFRDFVPSKLIDFMAVGRPVVLSAAGEAVRLLELAGAGVAVDPEDPSALAAALEALAADGAATASFGERGRAFARLRTRLRQAERLEHVLWSAYEGR